MYERLGDAALKDGPAELGVVEGPDPDWAGKLIPFLSHKGELWNWQNEWCLRKDPEGLTPFYYVCHREGKLLANVCNFLRNGVASFSHVYTHPRHRRKGACAAIIKALFDDFRKRGGRAMFLQTEYRSVPYRVYEKYGFRSVTEGSGFMHYFAKSAEEFEEEQYAPGEVHVRKVRFGDWPESIALFGSPGPGELRMVSPPVIGRGDFEGPFLRLLRAAKRGERRAWVLESGRGTVVGLCSLVPDARFGGGVQVLDLFVRPNLASRAKELLEAVVWPSAKVQAYVDSATRWKSDCLLAHGFEIEATLKKQVRGLDVEILSRAGATAGPFDSPPGR